jgi:hypothetical protein
MVFQLLRANCLFIKQSKCFFGEPTMAYLGHIISKGWRGYGPIQGGGCGGMATTADCTGAAGFSWPHRVLTQVYRGVQCGG